MTDGPPPKERTRILYGRRKGRPLRPRQRRLYETLFPEIEICLPEEGEYLDTADLFGPGMTDHWLEIGFGAGEHLIAQAAAHREVGIIGVEPFINGIGRVLTAIDDDGLDNVRLLCDDARTLLPHLSDGSMGRVFILFPDPWPKVRHHRRRIVSTDVLAELARIVRPGGELRLATDHPSYLPWMLEHLRANADFRWTARGPDDWLRRPEGWPATRYEAKAQEAGRSCAYLRYVRRDP